MSDQKRTYRKTRRAELEEETRLRITKSAVALHEELGPAHTSISAVAEHAGVRRSTVYRHFPDDEALFAACSATALIDVCAGPSSSCSATALSVIRRRVCSSSSARRVLR